MNSFIVVAFISTFCLAHARPGYLAGPVSLVGPPAPGALLKGPSASATLLGPDGSSISASALGGAVSAAPKAGGVVTAAVSPGYVTAAPALADPILGTPAWLAAPGLITYARAVLAGPSGTIVSPGLGAPLIAGPSKVLGGYYG